MSRPHDTGGGGRSDPDGLENQRLELIGAAISPDLEPLWKRMSEAGIPAAEQLELMRQIAGVQGASAWNGYTMARLQGKSRTEARQQPATAPLLAILDYVHGDHATLAPEYRRSYEETLKAIREEASP